MNVFTNLFASLIVATWIGAIAILSIQNVTPISLKFLTFESIQLPSGLVLAFSVGVGLIVGALIPILWQLDGGKRARYQYEDEDF